MAIVVAVAARRRMRPAVGGLDGRNNKRLFLCGNTPHTEVVSGQKV
jgi:hypothetical protein